MIFQKIRVRGRFHLSKYKMSSHHYKYTSKLQLLENLDVGEFLAFDNFLTRKSMWLEFSTVRFGSKILGLCSLIVLSTLVNLQQEAIDSSLLRGRSMLKIT